MAKSGYLAIPKASGSNVDVCGAVSWGAFMA